MAQVTGLSASEVSARRQRGEGNDAKIETSRSYKDILVNNIVNPINVILFAIGAIMIAIGRIGDAVTSVGLILMNVIIGVYQEIRAKRQLDHIALLTRPKITVLRDGQEQTVDPAELVKGDVIVVRAGDQVVVDGALVGDGKIDADESLLTGESDLIPKAAGSELLSGSFCVNGTAMYEATRVGRDSFANKLTESARKFQVVHTPLQREINLILRLLMLLAVFIGGTVLVSTILSQMPFMRQVQMAAVIAGLVPNGLFFMVILAYAMGALRIVQRGALIQQANAVESLSNVTVLCTDKTGTLTANKINYHTVYPIGVEQSQLESILADFARSATATNKTSEALIAGLNGTPRPIVDEVPFSSARKWSAVAFEKEGGRRKAEKETAVANASLHPSSLIPHPLYGVYVLGALEMLQAHFKLDQAAQQQVEDWSNQGLRVLVFAHNPAVTTLHDASGEPTLPDLKALGVVSFSDELRPHLKDTLAAFTKNGIALKVISGDNPQTVAALARQAGMPGDLKYVSGPELREMSDAQFKQAAEETTVFGRITPDQKEALVDALKSQGHYVAMIGDGVNDVLSLKKANLGIAMESGSAATRGVANMILLGDSFAALPPAFTEGQRIVNGMKDILRLFMTRVLYSALLIIAIEIIHLGFPFVPKHNALLVFLSVGAPTLALALWARPGPLPRSSMIREIAHFVLPAATTIFIFGLIVYIAAFYLGVNQLSGVDVTPDAIASFQKYTGITYDISAPGKYVPEVTQLIAQTSLTAFIVFSGLLLIVFVEPPTQWFVAGDEYSGDRRPTILAGGLLLIYFVIVAVDPLRTFFELMPLPLWGYLGIGLATLIWMLVLRVTWRRRWLERFLGVEW